MKKYIFLLLFSPLFVMSQSYQSSIHEEYIYDTIKCEYVTTGELYEDVTIKIDTLFNSISFYQKIDMICMKREFLIENYDFNLEEQTKYFFVKETEIPEKYSRKYIIYLPLNDSTICVLLEGQYAISYYLSQ